MKTLMLLSVVPDGRLEMCIKEAAALSYRCVFCGEEPDERIRSMAAENNAGVLVVSSELTELEILCDRVIVMRDGRGENVLVGDEITEENMMRYIAHAEGT